nr:DNA binding protein [Polyrhizophydium stewartii]
MNTLGQIKSWVADNFVVDEEASIPRDEIHAYFLAHCESIGVEPGTRTILGKAIRAVFPDVSTIRPGSRYNSKYHYRGIRPARDMRNFIDFDRFLAMAAAEASPSLRGSGATTPNVFSRSQIMPQDLGAASYAPEFLEPTAHDAAFEAMANLSAIATLNIKARADFQMSFFSYWTAVMKALERLAADEVLALVSDLWGNLPESAVEALQSNSLMSWTLVEDSVNLESLALKLPWSLDQPLTPNAREAVAYLAEALPDVVSVRTPGVPATLMSGRLRAAIRASSALIRRLRLSSTIERFAHMTHDARLMDALADAVRSADLADVHSSVTWLLSCSDLLEDELEIGECHIRMATRSNSAKLVVIALEHMCRIVTDQICSVRDAQVADALRTVVTAACEMAELQVRIRE